MFIHKTEKNKITIFFLPFDHIPSSNAARVEEFADSIFVCKRDGLSGIDGWNLFY
jgi:hypothetical protein